MSAVPGIGLHAYLSQFATKLEHAQDRLAAWVIAGVDQSRRHNGNVYLQLVDADQSDQGHGNVSRVKARALRANALLAAEPLVFDIVEGPLRAGQKVLVRVAPALDYFKQFVVDILEINTAYTLGELVVRAIETRQRLQAEGLYDRQAALPPPERVRRIAVIAPQASQGLEDFRESVAFCEAAGFIELLSYPAVFQGERAKASIPNALQQVIDDSDQQGAIDLVFLVRGGGESQDLSVLSEYAIAAAICRCRIPVWTGIGHERDAVIAQEVAAKGFGTPSKAAEALVAKFAHAGQIVVRALATLGMQGERLAAQEAQSIDQTLRRLRQRTAELADSDRERLEAIVQRVNQGTVALCEREQSRVDYLWSRVQSAQHRLVIRTAHEAELAAARAQQQRWRRAAIVVAILLVVLLIVVIF
jgi:exodeoxyribonuclease VII large subunit